MAFLLRAIGLVAVGLALASCVPSDSGRSPQRGVAGGPQLLLLDSLTLQEHDTAYVGQVREFAVDPYDGSYYVADRLAERVLRFDRHGALLVVYGSKGRGPGEITGIGPMMITDSSLYVATAENARIERFVRATGVSRGAFELTGFVSSFVRSGDVAWLGNYDPGRRTSVTAWEIDTKRSSHLIATPADYERTPALGGTFPGVFVAPLGDSLLVGFMATPYVVVATRTGTVTDTIRVPVRRRRPFPDPADVDRAMRSRQPLERFSAIPALFYVRLLPTGEPLLIHYDSSVLDGTLSSRVYVSLLSPDLRQACVDGELMVSADTEPMMGFRADTLFVLEGRVEGQRARNVVRRYLVSADGCDWIGTA